MLVIEKYFKLGNGRPQRQRISPAHDVDVDDTRDGQEQIGLEIAALFDKIPVDRERLGGADRDGIAFPIGENPVDAAVGNRTVFSIVDDDDKGGGSEGLIPHGLKIGFVQIKPAGQAVQAAHGRKRFEGETVIGT
jgi:hypothetical protein